MKDFDFKSSSKTDLEISLVSFFSTNGEGFGTVHRNLEKKNLSNSPKA